MTADDKKHFDFIVVGGGTAGNTVAGRLAETEGVRILIIEAGVGDPEHVADIMTPSAAMDLRGSQHDWAYKSTIVRRDDYERIEKPNTRGKVLGGSSALNYFTWLPGCKATFDLWRDYGGDAWTWDELLKYLRKSATYHDDDGLYPADLAKIGAGAGPIDVSHAQLLPEMSGFRGALRRAWTSRGEPLCEDVYDGEMKGLTHCVDSIYAGKRSGSFLFVRGKAGITVLAGHRSRRLLMDAEGRCTGVVAVDGRGGEHRFTAAREVVLSQGVFETPKLLMLSGVGPAAQLRRHGIDVVVDSPHVGQNLVDHPAVPFVLRLKDGFAMDDVLLRPGPAHDAAVDAYRGSASGPLASGLLELVGLPRIDSYLERDAAYREAKAANGGRDPFSPGGQPHFELDFVGMFGSAFQWHYPMPKRGNYVTVVVDLVRPVSAPGAVTLRSADADDLPDINLNFFESELDIVAMREGIRFSYDVLTKGDGFADLVEAQYPWDMPLDSDADMRRAVLDRCQTAFHPCGTARLSRRVDQGVVDERLRVHGVAGLRIVDASVIPVIPDCRIQNSVYMVGEKAADMIKEDHPDLFN